MRLGRVASNKSLASYIHQDHEACLALAHKTKELDPRAALLAFAYEFRTVAKRLQRDERKFSDGVQK